MGFSPSRAFTDIILAENLKSNYWKLSMEGTHPTANKGLMIEHYLYFRALSIQGVYSVSKCGLPVSGSNLHGHLPSHPPYLYPRNSSCISLEPGKSSSFHIYLSSIVT